MSSNITLPVGSEQEGQRIDKFLQESLPGMSRSQAQKWIVQGLVRIGEKAAGKNDKLKSGMVVSVELPIPPEELDGEPDWEEILHPTTLPQPRRPPCGCHASILSSCAPSAQAFSANKTAVRIRTDDCGATGDYRQSGYITECGRLRPPS